MEWTALAGRLGKVKNRILRVGIELEGGWAKLPEGWNLEHDGSVRIPPPMGMRILTGELPSPPLELPREKIFSHIDQFIDQCYPPYVNHTCGLHVHVSFKNEFLYQKMMSEDLMKLTISGFTAWAGEKNLPKDHPLWSRLRGESEYCQPRFDAERQSKVTRKTHDRNMPGNRYTMWNYCHKFHSTCECRMLPMMESPQLAKEAIHHLINIVNAYLSLQKREKKVTSSIIIDEEQLIQEINSLI